MKWIVFIVSFLGLVGCEKFSPTYHQPSIDVPLVSRSGVVFSAEKNEDYLDWWYKMHDPMLNELIVKTLRHNNQMMLAKHQIFKAQSELKAAQYSWIPTLNANAAGFFGGTISPNLDPQGNLGQVLPNNLSSGDFNGSLAQFIPTYSFNIFNNINEVNWAKASLAEKNAYLNAIRLSLISQTSGSYFRLLGLRKQQALQNELIADLENVQKIESNRLRAKKSDWATIYKIKTQIRQNRKNLPLIENSIAKTENALQLLTNENPGRVETNKDIDTLSVKGVIPSHLSSNVLKKRPDILMAEDRLKMANANVGLAQSVFFPTINLTNFFGNASLALENLFNLSTGFWANQAQLSMPILNSTSYAKIKAAKNGYYIAYYDYMQTVKSAFADVDNALTNNQKVNENYKETEQYVKDTHALYVIAMNRYKAGLLNYEYALRKKIDWDSARLTLNQAKMEQLDSIVTVYGALN